MRLDPISRRFGHGAAHVRVSAVPLAPAPAPTPFSGGGQAAATVVVGGLALFGLFRALNPDRPESSDLKIIPLVAEVIEPAPPPPPEPEPAPEPVVVAAPEPPPPPPRPEPEPVVVAKAEPPRQRPRPKPEPLAAPAPKLEPVKPPPPKPAPPPPARRPTPVVKFDAPKPVAEPIEDTRTRWRPVAVEKKPAHAAPKFPKIGIDAVGGAAPAPAPPERPTRVASLPPGAPGPTRRPPGPPRFAPPAAPAAAVPNDELGPPPATRAAAPSPVPSAAHGANHALASKKVAFAGAADTSATRSSQGSGPPTRERVAEAPLPGQPQRSEPSHKLRGVPLSSMAACRSDQREDALKLQVIAAVRNRKECSSGAGVYRFVETKNLNAFLLWIERAPGRAAVDRCAELGFALACLKQ